MIIDGIYVISVDLDQDFIQSVKDRLSKLRAPISKIQKKSIRIGSNKGDKILEVLTDLRKYPNWNLKNSETKFWNREITPGEVGCITSHMNMWSEFHQSETNVGLFLEQDFFPEFQPTNWSVFDEIEGYDWDIILLGRHQLGEDIETNFNYFIQPGYSYQAHAYLLSKKGADKLIKYYFKTLSKNLIPTDEFLPATFAKHPRADIERMYSIKHMNALALRVDMISQSDWEGTGRSRTAPK